MNKLKDIKNKIIHSSKVQLSAVVMLLAVAWAFYFQFNMMTFGSFENMSNNYIATTGKLLSTDSKLIPIYSVETEEKKVALTFNCAWDVEDIDDIIKILEKNEIKSTFFLTGNWINAHNDKVKLLYENGHEIGNHGYTHKNLCNMSYEECKKEIKQVHDAIYSILGIEINLLRAPSGAYNDNVIKAAEEMDYYTIQWDVDSLDWKDYGVDDILQRVLNHKDLRNGSIILMHTGTKYTRDSLQQLIDGLKNKGYDMVKVSELIYKEKYEIDFAGRQRRKTQ